MTSFPILLGLFLAGIGFPAAIPIRSCLFMKTPMFAHFSATFPSSASFYREEEEIRQYSQPRYSQYLLGFRTPYTPKSLSEDFKTYISQYHSLAVYLN